MFAFAETPLRRATILALCALFVAGCGRSRRPDLVLVTIDTLRPDALGWVASRNATPAIDRLASEGFAFPAAVSPVPLTLPAHVSLLTGLVPRRHGVRDNGQILDGALPTLAERLAAAGYRTGAIVSGYPLRRMFGLDRGFESFEDQLASRPDGRWQDRPAPATTALALEWLRGVKKKDPEQPYFLWVHYYDPHTPYEPAARFARPGPRGAYDGEVAAVDHALAKLREGLEESFPGRPRLTVLTADHGESLGEHGEATHGFYVYDSTTVVPLLFHAPGLVAPGKSQAPARLVDVTPTILEMLGLAPLPATDGASLAGFWSGRPFAIGPALVESRQPFHGYGWAPLTAWRSGDAKWIEAPKPELYDLAADPGETTNLATSDPRAEPLRRALANELRKPVVAEAGTSADPEVAAALRSLGYVGGANPTSAEPPAGLVDPKDRVHQKELLDLAEDSLAAGDANEALALFDLVREVEPENRFALLRSGQTLARGGQFGEAIVLLEKLLALDPEQPEARFELADALGRSGRTAAAVAQWMALLERQPRRAVAWSNLGVLLIRQGDLDKAEAALARAVALDESNAQVRRNLAECRYQQALRRLDANDSRAAQERLMAALAVLPDLRLRAASDPRLAPLLDARAPREALPLQ